jgi:Mor family transcriptional regulator
MARVIANDIELTVLAHGCATIAAKTLADDGMAFDEALDAGYRIMNGFLKAYAGSFLYIPKPSELLKADRDNEIRRLVNDEHQSSQLVAWHFGLSRQAVLNILKRKPIKGTGAIGVLA